jgi:hypothetical protein
MIIGVSLTYDENIETEFGGKFSTFQRKMLPIHSQNQTYLEAR